MWDVMVLLYRGMLLRTDSGLGTLATLHDSMIAGLMRSITMVWGRPCLSIKSVILYHVMSPEALLRSMRNPFNFDNEEQTFSLRASKDYFFFFANEGCQLLRCRESLTGCIDAFVSCVKQIIPCVTNRSSLLLINPYWIHYGSYCIYFFLILLIFYFKGKKPQFKYHNWRWHTNKINKDGPNEAMKIVI